MKALFAQHTCTLAFLYKIAHSTMSNPIANLRASLHVPSHTSMDSDATTRSARNALVCIHVCVCACVCVCARISSLLDEVLCGWQNKNSHILIHIFTNTHTQTHTFTYTHTHMYTFTNVRPMKVPTIPVKGKCFRDVSMKF
jgi:hypothetical protein